VSYYLVESYEQYDLVTSRTRCESAIKQARGPCAGRGTGAKKMRTDRIATRAEAAMPTVS